MHKQKNKVLVGKWQEYFVSQTAKTVDTRMLATVWSNLSSKQTGFEGAGHREIIVPSAGSLGQECGPTSISRVTTVGLVLPPGNRTDQII